jgi:hypothetical protein
MHAHGVAQLTLYVFLLRALASARQINGERGWGWFGGANTYCRGTHRAAHVGIGLLAIYLALFIQLYIKTYTRRDERAPAEESRRDGAAKKTDKKRVLAKEQ